MIIQLTRKRKATLDAREARSNMLAHECAAQEMRFYHGEVRGEAEDAVEDEAPVPG